MKTAIIGMLLLPSLLMAQQNGGAWTNVGPSPAAVRSIVVDAQGSGTIFLGSIAGGVRKSIDGGTTWSAVNRGLTTPTVNAIAVDASGPQTVYAGTSGSLFKTSYGGATWQNIPAISGAIVSVAADPNQSGVVYAGVFSNLANGSIRKSTDGGVTWTTILTTTAAIFNITIDPGNSDVLYAPTVGHGAFKSTDGGQHWSPMSALTPAAVWTLALDRTNRQVLYAGTNENGVWKSTDAGTTWQQVGSPGPFPVNSLSLDPSATRVYAGTNGGGVWKSTDGGVTWQSTRLTNGMVWSLVVDSAGAVYAGTNAAGAQVSRDGGATWTVLPTGVDNVNKFGYGAWIDPSNGRKILVSSEFGYGMFWTQDGGASWSIAGQGFTGYGSRGVAFDPSNSQRIYAGGMVGNGFFKSTDGGLTWSPRRFGTAAVYVIAVAVDPLSPNIVYAGTQNEGIFKSTDYGETWASAGSGLSGAITFLTPDPSKSGRLFASTATAFYLSEDAGKSWTNALNLPAWTVSIDPNRPSTVYATARTQGVFRSIDGGHTWLSINTGLTSLTMGRSAPVIIDPTSPQTLYVGSEGGGGVFKSLDGGDHWFAVNSGLDELTVDGLAMDPRNPGVLYACGPNGVYKTATGAEVLSTPTISGVANAASYLTTISSREIVVITGSGLGPSQLVSATPAGYAAQLSGTEVRFNGIPALLIYASATQVAAFVPDLVPGLDAHVTVTYEGRASSPFTVTVVPAAPGLFTLDASGKGQVVALNQNGSLNSASNPAKTGELVTLFATGITGPALVSIGGSALPGGARDVSSGLTEIDVPIPVAVQGGTQVPVLVKIGNATSQDGVTIAVAAASQPPQYVVATYAGGAPPRDGGTAIFTPIGYVTAVAAVGAESDYGSIYFVTNLNCVFQLVPRLGTIARVAGTSQAGYSGDGGSARDAELFTTDPSEEPGFGFPGGIVVDSSGALYFSDPGNHRVRRVAGGIITTVAGNGTAGYSGDGKLATGAQLNYPAGLAIDALGNLYIADVGQIRMVAPNGVISTVAPFGTLGIAIDKSGNLYVASGAQIRKVSPDGTLTVVAGNGQIGDGGDGGPATSAQLIGPTGVALDNEDNLYIADISRVRKVSPDGVISTVAGGGNDGGDFGQATSARIDVEGIAFDNAGTLYIASNFFVRQVTPDGAIAVVAGNRDSPNYSGDGGRALDARLNAPRGVAVDQLGILYIADSQNYRVRKVSPGTGVITTAAGTGIIGYSGDGGPATSAQLTSPVGLAADSQGNLYIGDGSRVRKVLADGTILTVAGNGSFGYSGDRGLATAAQITVPSGLAVDRAGNLYILDTENNRVRKVSPDGIITTFAGNGIPGYSGDGGPATNAQLGITYGIHAINPAGLAFDGAGNLFIADDGNVRVRKVSPDGIITTVAGSARVLGYFGDGGLATEAQMNFPTALAADQTGNLFIGEGTRVRKVSFNGIITTVAANGSGVSADAPGSTVELGSPAGLAIGAQGRIYLADPNFNKVRLMLPVGVQ